MPDPEPVEVAGILWLAEREFPYREKATDAILDFFLADLPETAKMVNCGAVVDALTTDADSDPPEGVYVHFTTQLQFLVNMGLLLITTDDNWTEEDKEGTETVINVYSLTEQAFLVYRSTRRKLGYE